MQNIDQQNPCQMCIRDRDYAEKNGITIEGLKKPKSDISEHEEEEEY